MSTDIAKLLAKKGFEELGLKKGNTVTSKRVYRAVKRGNKAKVLKLLLEDT